MFLLGAAFLAYCAPFLASAVAYPVSLLGQPAWAAMSLFQIVSGVLLVVRSYRGMAELLRGGPGYESRQPLYWPALALVCGVAMLLVAYFYIELMSIFGLLWPLGMGGGGVLSFIYSLLGLSRWSRQRKEDSGE